MGFAPGGVADITVQIGAQQLSDQLKQRFVGEPPEQGHHRGAAVD